MSSMEQIESLLRRNAEACENAKRHRCTCQCQGALHGKPHSEEWIDLMAQRLYANQEFPRESDDGDD